VRKEQEIVQLLGTFLDASPITATEVLYHGFSEATTRFANNLIHQNVAEENDSVTLRTMKEGHVGLSTSNQFNPEHIKELVQTTVSLMTEQPAMDFAPELRGPSSYSKLDNFDEKTAVMTARDRASIVQSIINQVSEHKLMAAGALVTGYNDIAIRNSKGLNAFHRSSHFEISLTIYDQNGGSSWMMVEGSRTDLDLMQQKLSTCIERTLLNKNPRTLKPGRYTVILEPAAVGTMVEFLGYLAFGAKDYLLGRSCFHNMLGQHITGNLVTIDDDAYHPQTIGLPFDYEGTARQKVRLIDKGIAAALVHDSSTARQMNTETTGHSLPQPNEIGPMPANLVMAAGHTPLDQMIAQSDQAILVTRFHYNRVVDRKNAVITGLTRDGLFAVRDGEIAFPLHNFRYNTNIMNAFSRIEQLSSERFLVGEYSKVVTPALKIKDFLFTDVSAQNKDDQGL